jgi:hypothetical protein
MPPGREGRRKKIEERGGGANRRLQFSREKRYEPHLLVLVL